MMTQPAPAKFNFDVDMSTRGGRGSASDKKLQAMLAEARQDGFAAGREAGAADATIAAQKGLQAAAEKIAQQSTQLLGKMDMTHKQALTQSAQLGVTIGRKLAGHLIAKMPAGELDPLIKDCMVSLGTAPHLAIRCHPDLTEIITDLAESHAHAAGYTGRLLVIGEPEIALGDGRLEWVDGGLVRENQAIAAEIETILQAHLAAKGAPQMDLNFDAPDQMQEVPRDMPQDMLIAEETAQ